MSLYDEYVTDIRKTNDYDKFKNILGNRDLNDRNYSKLIRSMAEKLLIIPVLVNERYEIIDGQHRFMACKQLRKPVFYYMVEGYEIEDVKRANLVSCNWGLEDYLNLHLTLKKEDYIEFEELRRKYGMRVNQILEIIATFEKKDYRMVRLSFEDGSFTMNNVLEVQNFLLCLADFRALKESTSPKFTKAFLKLYTYDKYDHASMCRRMKTLGHKLKKQTTYGEYLALLVNEIYAFGSSHAGFRYDSIANRFYEV